MADIKLTKRVVENLKSRDQDYVAWDRELNGFGVRVRKSGTKTYVFKYRYRDKQRWFSIGKHGTVSLEKARQKAGELNHLVFAGSDPETEKQAARKAMTVSQLCELYLEEGVSGKKPQTVAMDRIRINTHVKPLIGHVKIQDLTRRDIQKLMTRIATPRPWVDPKALADARSPSDPTTDAQVPRKRTRKTYSRTVGGEGAANRTIGMLGGIFSFAIDRHLRDDNPVLRVKKYREKTLNRRLEDKELRRLAAVLDARELTPGGNPAVNAIRLLLLLGCRKSEVLTLKWEDVYLDRRIIHLRDSKTGERYIQVNTAARDAFRRIRRIPGNPYVIPGLKEGSHMVGLQKFWEKVRKDARIPDVRVHDLRHTYASVAADMGFSLHTIGKLLGHRKASSTERYAHVADAPLKQATEAISEGLTGRMLDQYPRKIIPTR